MRKLDGFFTTGKTNLMTDAEDGIVIDSTKLWGVPAIDVRVDNSYLDVEDDTYESRLIEDISTGDDHNFSVTLDGGVEYDADDLSTDDLVRIAECLEKNYNRIKEK
jgi:hypothetical protein